MFDIFPKNLNVKSKIYEILDKYFEYETKQ